MSHIIRLALATDAVMLAEAHVAAWQAAYRGQMPDEVLDALSRAEFEASWRTRLAATDSKVHTWVADEAGLLRGFASSGPCRDEDVTDPGTGELYAINLEPGAWGRGMGQALFQQTRSDLLTRGFRDMVLWVLRTNARARRFYERAGMRPDGAEKLKPYRHIFLDEVRYRMPL